LATFLLFTLSGRAKPGFLTYFLIVSSHSQGLIGTEDMFLKVLVADDTLTNRTLTARILEKRGHVVITVENGAAAVERLTQEDFDVVVMDIQMPVMSGIEAAKIIRGVGSPVRRPDVPIVAVSAYGGIEGKKECLNAGMNVFLSKPVPADTLADTCERYSRSFGTADSPR
jgi:CheY-like chemotaxis protein